MNIFIYGTGSGAIKFYQKIDRTKFNVIGFLDSNIKKHGEKLFDITIQHPSYIKNNEFDYIFIASDYYEIKNYVISFGIESNKIKFVYTKALYDYLKKEINTNKEFIDMDFICTRGMAYCIENNIDNEYEDMFDYTRYKTLELVKEEIIQNNVPGQVAEVGVYRGDFSKIINILFPDRKLYLFDTFEGFEDYEQEHDIKSGYFDSEFLNECNFKDTSIEIVANKMRYPNQCIFKKGYFPKTAENLEERFAFVSIDVDLFIPILNSLEYFYPRLNEGGYMFIHDYKNKEFRGVRDAIKKYEEKNGRLMKVPLSDQGGTIIITK